MSFSSSIVADFAVIMTIAAIVFWVFHKLKQPTILGYLIAGVIIGPHTAPFKLVSNLEVFRAAADLGVILLLFAIGLSFPLARLRKVGRVSAGVATIEIALMLLLSFGIAWLLRWPGWDALFLGTALASSSTAIISKELGDIGKLKDTSALVMLGVLVVEDIIVVGLLAVIMTVVGTGSLDFASLAWLAARIVAFVLGVLVLGIATVPTLIDRAVRLGNGEVLILIILGLCFGSAVVTSLLGFSMAIGAFLMGVVVAGARSAEKVATLVAPVKDMFAAIFFVSMGALIDVTQFQVFLLPALLVTGLMVMGKIAGCGFGTRISGYDRTVSLRVGLGMSQIGEFAFIVMRVGQDLNVTSLLLFEIVGVAAAITAFLTPYLMRLGYRLPERVRAAEPV